jgi:hypothetical protein
MWRVRRKGPRAKNWTTPKTKGKLAPIKLLFKTETNENSVYNAPRLGDWPYVDDSTVPKEIGRKSD